MTKVLPAVWTALGKVCLDDDLRGADVNPKLHAPVQKFKIEANFVYKFLKNLKKCHNLFKILILQLSFLKLSELIAGRFNSLLVR